MLPSHVRASAEGQLQHLERPESLPERSRLYTYTMWVTRANTHLLKGPATTSVKPEDLCYMKKYFNIVDQYFNIEKLQYAEQQHGETIFYLKG